MPVNNGVVLFGLDSGNFDIIFKFLDSLPNFRLIVERGIINDLISTIPPLTPPAWSAIITGKNPGKTDVYDWIHYDRRQRKVEISSFNLIKGLKIWDILAFKKLKSCIVNLPLTYPAKPINGVMVSGIPGHVGSSSKITYPRDLIHKLNELVDGYEIIPYVDLRVENLEKEFFYEFKRILKKRFEVFKFLYDYDCWHFFMPVIFVLDSVHHYYWHHLDPTHPNYDPKLSQKYVGYVKYLYRMIDSFLGWLIKRSKEDHFDIIMVSDHGMGPLRGNFLINKYLFKKGYLKLCLTENMDKKTNFTDLVKSTYTRITMKVKQARKIVELLTNLLPMSFFEKFTVRGADKSKAWLVLSNLDTNAKDNVFALGEFGQIYIDSLNSYQTLLNSIISDIKNDFARMKINVDVFIGKQIYNGKYISNAPDIIIMIEENLILPDISLIDLETHYLFSSNKLKAAHRLNGIFMAYGENINNLLIREHIRPFSVYDITPTILSLFNIPLTKEFDGKPLLTKKVKWISNYGIYKVLTKLRR